MKWVSMPFCTRFAVWKDTLRSKSEADKKWE